MRLAVAALLGCVLAVWSAVSIARAQQRQAITQDQAQARAEQRAPEVLVSLAQVAVARSEADVAGMYSNPQVGGGVSPAYLFIATFYVRLPIFGQRGMAERAALAQARVAQASTAVVRLDARLAAALAWIDLWAALRETALADAQAARHDRMLAAAQARVADGSAPELDRLRAEASARRAHSQRDALLAAQVAASARLAVLLAGPSDDVALSPSGEPRAGEPPAPASIDAYVNAHPAARHASAAIGASDAAVAREQRARWPELGLSVQDWASRKSSTHDVRVVATVDVPIFGGPRVARAKAALVAAQTRADATRAHLRAAAVAARADYVAAQRRCEALSDSVLPAAREVADRSEQAYLEGSLDLAATQLAAQSYSNAERELLTCRADRARAWARLQHALGGFRVP